MLSGAHYDRIKRPVFLFDEHVDAVYLRGTVFILNKANFQRIFQFFDLVKEVARETLDTIGQAVPIAGFEELKEACEGHLQMLAKLKNISEKPYLKDVTIKDVKLVIRDYGLNLEVVREGGVEKVRFDPKNKWELLRLFDDDYLESTLTRRRYQAAGKRERS